jgi:hypothetical protein
MNGISGTLLAVFTLIIGVAVVAVLVSQQAQTAAVIQAIGSAAGNAIGTAVSPVTGNSATLSLAYPSSSTTTGG